MDEVTKIDIACGWDVKNGQDVLVAKTPNVPGHKWSLWRSEEGKARNLSTKRAYYYATEQEDSVLGLIGVVISKVDGSIISIDDWELYDADFDASQELLDQLQVWTEYEVTEDTSNVNTPAEDKAAQTALAEIKELMEEAVMQAFSIKPKTTMQRLKDIAVSLAVAFGLSILATLTSTLMFMFAVINMHKNVEHIMEFGMGGAEYLTSALALMLFAMAWFATERMFSWVWGKK